MSTETNAETMATADGIAVPDSTRPSDAPPAPPTAEVSGPPDATATAATAATAATDPGAATIAGATAVAVLAAAPARRARARLAVASKRLLRLVVAVAMFGAGAWLGYQVFVDNQPDTVVTGDPAVVGNPTPAAVAELVNAIAADDADAIRAALDPQIFSNYTADLQNFGISRVEGAEAIGTYVDGPRTATVLVIHGRDAERNPFSINLVVQTENGQIVRLR